MLRRRSVLALSARAAQAAQTIASFIADHHITVTGRAPAWGQFLAQTDNQSGVYGTSAAIQVLARSDKAGNSELLTRASSALTKLDQTPTLSTLHKRRDQVLTHKLAFATGALAIGADLTSLTDSGSEANGGGKKGANVPAQMLLRNRIAGGWGWYQDGQNEQDFRVRTIPTCMALLALSATNYATRQEDLLPPLNHLANTSLTLSNEQIVDASLILIVLLKYSPWMGQITQYPDAVSSCREIVLEYVKGTEPDPEGEFFDENYAYKLAGEPQEHDYLTYPKDVIAAQALLELHDADSQPSPVTGCSKFLCQVADKLCRNVEKYGAFRARTTLLLALVDQVWVYNFLLSFARASKEAPASFLTRLAAAVNRTPRRRLATFLIVATATILSTWAFFDIPTGPMRVVWAAVAAVSASLTATLLADTIRGT